MAPLTRSCLRSSRSAGLGTGSTPEEAESAHSAIHADGAFDSLPPSAPGELVLRARARGHLRRTGRRIEGKTRVNALAGRTSLAIENAGGRATPMAIDLGAAAWRRAGG